MTKDNDEALKKFDEFLKELDIEFNYDGEFSSAFFDNINSFLKKIEDSEINLEAKKHHNEFIQNMVGAMNHGGLWLIPKTNEVLQLDKENKCFVTIINKGSSDLRSLEVMCQMFSEYKIINIREFLAKNHGKKVNDLFPWVGGELTGFDIR